MMKKLKAAWWRLPSWLRAAINTGWAAFLGTIGMPVLRWLDDFRLWVGGAGTLPSAELLGRTVAAAGVALLAGLWTAMLRRRRPPESAYPAKPDS